MQATIKTSTAAIPAPSRRTPNRGRKFTEGFILDEVAIERQGQMRRADYLVSDTRMQIRLSEALKPAGGAIRLTVHKDNEMSVYLLRSVRTGPEGLVAT